MTRVILDQQTTSDLDQTFRALRSSEFPWTGETTYLNNAGTGPIPERTRRVIEETTARRTAPQLLPDRDVQLSLSEARTLLARLINAEPEEIALATSTSFGLALAARALPLERGEIVLVSQKEFPAVVYPWMLLQERGVTVELARTTPQGWPDEDFLLERLRDPRVKALAVSWVQFSTGFRADLARLSTACRANGTFLIVDAIQGVGQLPLDVRRTPVDVLACGGQKWLLSPWGSAFVYVRKELIPILEPTLVGWNAFAGTDDYSRLTEYDLTFKSDARRYEVGTLPFQDFVGMIESLKMLLELGLDRVAARNRVLRQPLLEAAERGEIEITSPRDCEHDSSIVCVSPDHVAETFLQLKKNNVVCALREGRIRLSPHCYNTVEEVEKVVAILTGR
jgi:selenocysteine lyase/cysteine desulfurase